ncbi:hypothetical protein SAMN05421595_1565 [Austwickia chelonae]|nr:hypothetical protein SAMN05421595_1565 [Austwickia chelonae]
MPGAGRSRWNRVDGEQQPSEIDDAQAAGTAEQQKRSFSQEAQTGKNRRDAGSAQERSAKDARADKKFHFRHVDQDHGDGRGPRRGPRTGRDGSKRQVAGSRGQGERRDSGRRGSSLPGSKNSRDERGRPGWKGGREEQRLPRSQKGTEGRSGVRRPDEKSEFVTRGGSRLAPKHERKPDPAIDADITGLEIDRAIKNELRTLSKDNAKGVGQHLVMISRLLDVDIEGARAHAETAVRRAGRVAAVREARGLVAYREGDYQMALSEFRTARRLSGSQHLLPLMVDCERGLGRPERALELAGSPEARTLTKSERVELLIVCSGIRRDMGHLDASVVLLETPDLDPNRRDPWSARLFYAYGDALMSRGDTELARAWFAEAADADVENLTDAAERLDEIDGIVFVDLGEEGEALVKPVVGLNEDKQPEESPSERIL